MTHSNRSYPNRVSKFIGSMTVEELRDYLDFSIERMDDDDNEDSEPLTPMEDRDIDNWVVVNDFLPGEDR